MATVTFRFHSILLRDDGQLDVDVMLPDGSIFRGVVPATMNTEELALSVVGAGPRLHQMTGAMRGGNVDVDEGRYEAAVAARVAAQAADVQAEVPAVEEPAASTEEAAPAASARKSAAKS